MDYVNSFDMFGAEVRQLPSITGSGAPTTATVGAIGDFYMDTETGDIYKCIAVANGVYTWQAMGSETTGIIRIESTEQGNYTVLRELASGTYILYGKFRPYAGSNSILTFSSNLLVGVVTKTAATHVQVFYPVDNAIQFLNITDDTFEKTVINLNDLANAQTSVRIGEVALTSSGWIGEKSPYAQVVNIDGVTANSQVDLTPSVEQLAIFYEKDLAFVTENDNGVVTVYAIGQKPANDYTIQVTITEVAI